MVVVRFITITTWDRIVDYRSIDVTCLVMTMGALIIPPTKAPTYAAGWWRKNKGGTDRRQESNNKQCMRETNCECRSEKV